MTHRREKGGRRFPLASRHRYIAWAGVVVCCGFVVVGILLLVGGIREWQIQSASVNWPALQAEIIQSEVVKRFYSPPRREITSTRFEREISVRYSVNGAEYSTDFKIPVDTPNAPPANHPYVGFSSKTNIERVTLYYDPKNPREAVLHPGDQGTAVYGIASGGTFAVLFSMAIFVIASALSNPAARG